MKHSHLKLLSMVALLIFIPRSTHGKKTTQKQQPVKVLIEEHDRTKNRRCSSWKLTSNTGFLIFNPTTKTSCKSSEKTSLTITHNQSRICVNGISYPGSELRIIPRDGYAGINGTQFHGSFSITQTNDHTYLINHVDLEEYVCSVLKTESWPGWPVEVNKAFAISSRSYVLAMIKQAQKSTLPYHVKNTNEHQTYKGMHTTSAIHTAVALTKGMVLTHNGQIALTMFDSCCGGVIPAHIEDFDFGKAPYLARTYACTHCSRCKIYAWQKEIHLADISKFIAQFIEYPGVVQQIKIAKKDKARLITQVHVKKGNKKHTLSGKQLYSALPEIKSFCYSIKRKKDTLVFNGKGYGHHIGMCQWGAREMVRDGWHYKRILDFYYPGTVIRKIS